MKKSDIGVIVVMYAIVLLFFIPTLFLPSDAQIYPLVVMAVMVLLNTIYLVKCLTARSKAKEKKIKNDLSSIFENFQAKQFFMVAASCVVYIYLISLLGFYAATVLYLIGSMIFLKVPKKPLIITLLCFTAMVYATFTLFLDVPLPTGILM
jgi:hypothetical protein